MFQGKTNAALQLLSTQGKGGVLRADDVIDVGDHVRESVLDVLRSKHPHAQPVSPGALPQGIADPPVVHPVVFDQITAACIHRAALRTKGAAGVAAVAISQSRF